MLVCRKTNEKLELVKCNDLSQNAVALPIEDS